VNPSLGAWSGSYSSGTVATSLPRRCQTPESRSKSLSCVRFRALGSSRYKTSAAFPAASTIAKAVAATQ